MHVLRSLFMDFLMLFTFYNTNHAFGKALGKLALSTFLVLAAMSSNVYAHEYKVGALEIIHPWSRATPQGAKVAGGYFKIINHGQTADRLIAVTSELSDKTEIHSMTVTGGTMKMMRLPNGIEIAAGGTVEFKPGSFHVMFINIPAALKQGESFKSKLIFAKAGEVEVTFVVDALGAKTPAEKHRNHANDHH